MDGDDHHDDDDGGGELPPPLPPWPPPAHQPPPRRPFAATATTPTTTSTSSLASEAYLAVRDFLSASVAEARGDRGSAAAYAAASASRVQTAVEAEAALPRGDFGPVCELLATAFAWKAQALSDALDSADAGAAACPSPSLLSAALPPPLQFAAAAPHHRHRHHPARPSRLPLDDEDDELLLLDPPPPRNGQRRPHVTAGAHGDGTTTTAHNDINDEDASLEAELVRRCVRRPAGTPADPHALSRVQGLGDVKRELEDAMLLPLRLPPRLRACLRGVRRPPRTFLLHGPPGTGKTLLAEAAAAAAGACLLCASPSAVLSKWAGDSERAVRLLFKAAARLAPCVVFLDEIDALGASRGGFAASSAPSGGGGGGGSGDGGSGAGGNQDALARRVLTELLVQMSRLEADAEEAEEEDGKGAPPRPPVWVLAATNRPCDVDPALLRRFERRVAVPLPDAEGRAALVRAALRELEEAAAPGHGDATPPAPHELTEADVARVAEASRGLSGADLRAVARRAAMAPVGELSEAMRQRERQLGARKRPRGQDEEEEDEADDDDGSLQLRPVRASDWHAALAALFGGDGGGARGEAAAAAAGNGG